MTQKETVLPNLNGGTTSQPGSNHNVAAIADNNDNDGGVDNNDNHLFSAHIMTSWFYYIVSNKKLLTKDKQKRKSTNTFIRLILLEPSRNLLGDFPLSSLPLSAVKKLDADSCVCSPVISTHTPISKWFCNICKTKTNTNFIPHNLINYEVPAGIKTTHTLPIRSQIYAEVHNCPIINIYCVFKMSQFDQHEM
jgi:hypothetical protein